MVNMVSVGRKELMNLRDFCQYFTYVSNIKSVQLWGNLDGLVSSLVLICFTMI